MFAKINLRLIIFALCVLFSMRAASQKSIDPAEVEQESYKLYMEAKWPELISCVNNALKLNVDYFYLRMRIGIAYYERKNYRLAEGHFQKALAFNSGDDLALEYLYYCYLLTGRNEDARKLSSRFGTDLAEKTKTANQLPIGFGIVEGGTKISDSSSYYDAAKKSSTNFFNPAIYFHVGLNHYVKNKASFFHAFTFFNQESFTGKVGQLQYYLKSSVPFRKNWLVSPSLHLVNINFTTEVPLPPPPPGAPPLTQTAQVSSTVSTYFVGSLAVQKDIKKFTFSLNNTYSNLYNVNQLLHSGMAYYSPFGNSKIIVGCTAYLHTINNYSTTNTSFVPFIFAMPSQFFSLKFNYLLNKNNNIIEENGYIVNNSVDLTKSRFGIVANAYLSKRLSVYAVYLLEFKQEAVQLFNYRYHVIVGGIKITP